MISNKNKQQYNKQQYKNALYNNKQYGGMQHQPAGDDGGMSPPADDKITTIEELKKYIDRIKPAILRYYKEISIAAETAINNRTNDPAGAISGARRSLDSMVRMINHAENIYSQISTYDSSVEETLRSFRGVIIIAEHIINIGGTGTLEDLHKYLQQHEPPRTADDYAGAVGAIVTPLYTSITEEMIKSHQIKNYEMSLYIDDVLLINYIDYDSRNPILFDISESQGKRYKGCVINWVSESLREYYNKLDPPRLRDYSGGATGTYGTSRDAPPPEPPKAYAKISFKRIMDIYIQDQTETITPQADITFVNVVSELSKKICSNDSFNQKGNNIEAYKTVIKNLYKNILEICRGLDPDSITPNIVEFDIIYKKLFSQPGEDNLINYRNFIMYPTQIFKYLYFKIKDDTGIHYLPVGTDSPRLPTIILNAGTEYSFDKIYTRIKELISFEHAELVDLYIIYPYIQDSNIFNEIKESENPPADNNLTFNNEDNTPIIDGQRSNNTKQIEHKITNRSTTNDYYNIFVNYGLLEPEPPDVPFTEYLNKICKDLISKKDDCLHCLVKIISEDPSKYDNLKKIIDYFNELEYSEIEENINNADSLVILFILHHIFKFTIYKEPKTNIYKLLTFDMWIANIQNYDNTINDADITSIKTNSKLQIIFEKMHKKVPLNILNDNDPSFKLHRKYNTKKQPPEHFVRKAQIGKFEEDEQTGGVSKLNSTFKNSINQQLYNINNILKVNTHVIKQMGGQSSPDFINKIEKEMDKYLQLSVKLKPLLQIVLPYTSEDQTQFKKGIQTIENNEKIIKQIIKIFLYYKKLKLSEPNYMIPLQDNVFMDENKRSTLYNTLKLKLQDTKNITSSILYEFKKIIS